MCYNMYRSIDLGKEFPKSYFFARFFVYTVCFRGILVCTN